MDAYVFQAELYCEDCAREIRDDLRGFGTDLDDSDTYPQGPYLDGGGESDTPAHCGGCGGFLENPLTDDGMRYVKETVAQDIESGNRESVAVETWAPFYGIETEGESDND